MKMKNRVYGVVAIKSRMANWNADFTGRPKTTANGDIFGSDKAFKYPIKRMWENEGEKVLYLKSFKIDEKAKEEEKSKLQPRDLWERYLAVFPEVKAEASVTSKEILENLFKALDVINFGATFAADRKRNISITGAVQVGQGYNKYAETIIESQAILSPFRNSSEKKEEASATTLGTKIVVDEAHYFYPFTVNPENYQEYISLIEGFEGYTQAAYHKFKAGCLVAATAFNTNSKMGCENEFALFVECRDEARLYLANLDQYIGFTKEDGKAVINLAQLGFLADFKEQIAQIEVYYNPLTVVVQGESLQQQGLNYQEKNLFTAALLYQEQDA